MNIINRVKLSITRNKKRAIIFFALFFFTNLILLAGLSLAGASDSALKSVRSVMNPVIEYKSIDESHEIDVQEIQSLIRRNDKIKAVNYVRKEMMFAGSFKPLTKEEIVLMYDGGGDENSPNISISGSYFVDMIQFEANEFSLINGRLLEQSDFDQNLNVGLIEMTLANKNNIAIGDTITLNTCSLKEIENLGLGDDQVQIEIEVVGIFKNNLNDDENTGIMFKPENTIYVSGKTVDEITYMKNDITNIKGLSETDVEESKLKNSVLIALENALLIDDFISENQDITNRVFDAHDEQFVMYSQNFIILNLFGKLIVSVICVNVVIVLALLIAMKFYGRKKELASMFCMGVSKTKLYTQLVIETLIIQFIAFSLSTLLFSVLLMPANTYFMPENNVQVDKNDEELVFDTEVDYFSAVDYSDFNDNFLMDINIEMIVFSYLMQVMLICICEYSIFCLIVKFRIRRLME